MTKNKYIWGSVIGVWVLLLAGGAFFVWHSKQVRTEGEVLSAQTAGATNESSSSQAVTDNSTTGSINSSPANSGSGITISGQAPTTQSSNNSAQTNAASALLDPTTFKQYDQYKTGTAAMYRELAAGDGEELVEGKTAVVLYRGWLTDGTLFDQSRAGSDGKLQAFSFQLGAHGVIPGWEQGLAGMKKGGVRLLIIPPSVGYGESGQSPIPGNAVLVFQVQLVAIQ